jgi:acyl-CoA synthetase (NDP forming)
MNAPSKTMTRDLSRLLSPRSVAFIGGGECDVAIARTRDLGFTGKIWAVHPKRDNLGGIPCVRSVEEIDGTPDAAFIAVRREPTIEVVRSLRAKGCGGAVIYASGFAETGDTHLQDELLAAAACRSWDPTAMASSTAWPVLHCGRTNMDSTRAPTVSRSSPSPATLPATSP